MKLKKLLFALGISLVFVVALSFSVFADTVFTFDLTDAQISSLLDNCYITAGGTSFSDDNITLPFDHYHAFYWPSASSTSTINLYLHVPFGSLDLDDLVSFDFTIGSTMSMRTLELLEGNHGVSRPLKSKSTLIVGSYSYYTGNFTEQVVPSSAPSDVRYLLTVSSDASLTLRSFLAINKATYKVTFTDQTDPSAWLEQIYRLLESWDEAIRRNDVSSFLEAPEEWIEQLEAEREAAESSADRLESLIEQARVTLPEYEAPNLGDLELYNTALIAGSFDVIFDSMDFLLPLLLVTIGLCIGSYLLYGKKGD